ncbi:hypothetical protein SERLA73DRAFT_178127 [Serpula lacrymans var. lacrymans S7.3]|uniref:Uncharacterized protein n=2 Tax=Serpula lacrymans var. lacrymans TaxID=341189 RepID=F8PQM2_SERL3|nr:uncharacterized protein SERLADRAFT_462409 [Serpula lacrymans var. lacrymans S7.9]EGO02270.1 hypothetical protein SERLA73DRAFT_178127 [Serpula lacrymans var. lacrymans S7.3]EGO28014.1 hypothetical protein SERLADRAFT_462409 [Serpula lacrymans var. lacrymans S7.9]
MTPNTDIYFIYFRLIIHSQCGEDHTVFGVEKGRHIDIIGRNWFLGTFDKLPSTHNPGRLCLFALNCPFTADVNIGFASSSSLARYAWHSAFV